jgi:hypothetical protein
MRLSITSTFSLVILSRWSFAFSSSSSVNESRLSLIHLTPLPPGDSTSYTSADTEAGPPRSSGSPSEAKTGNSAATHPNHSPEHHSEKIHTVIRAIRHPVTREYHPQPHHDQFDHLVCLERVNRSRLKAKTRLIRECLPTKNGNQHISHMNLVSWMCLDERCGD